MDKLPHFDQRTKEEPLDCKKGPVNISLLSDEIVFLYTGNKVVYVLDKKGK